MSNAWETQGHAGNFQTAVIQASLTTPVLVDFWAEWCAPCRALAPVIDDLANKLKGALLVVKVDTDTEQALAGEYAIRSLPTIMIFRDGKAVKQVIGSQTLGALEALVTPYLAQGKDADLDEVYAAMDAGNHAGAAIALEQAIAKNDSDFRLPPLLAECYIALGRLDDARALIGALPANIAVGDRVLRVVARLNLATSATIPGDDEATIAYRAAVAMVVAGDYDSGVAALIALLGSHRQWQEDRIRKTLVDVFSILEEDPRLKTWRTKMARMLN